MTKKEHNTKTYYKENHYQMTYKRLTMATHWIDPINSEKVVLTLGLKAVYHHRLEQYRSFTSKGMVYKESHQAVADKLGLSIDSVKKTYTPILKRMGLLQSEGQRSTVYHVFPLSFLVGTLINEKLSKREKPLTHKKDKDFNYDTLKIIEHNQKQVNKVKENNKEKCYVLTESEMRELLERSRK